MADHKPGYILAVVLTVLISIATIVINTLDILPTGREIGLMVNSQDHLAIKYYVEILPAAWTYTTMFITTSVFQGLWLIYGLTTLCRRNSTYMSYLYITPNFMPVSMYLVQSLGLMATIAWILMFDREYILISFGLVAVAFLLMGISLGISLRALCVECNALLRMNHQRDIGGVRWLVQNGVAYSAAWLFAFMHHFLAIVLAHRAQVDQRDASTIALGILGFFIVLYFLLDTMALDKYSRYVVTPYLVLAIALVGTAMVNWGRAERNAIIAAVLAGLSVFALLAKLILACGRCRRDPEPMSKAVR